MPSKSPPQVRMRLLLGMTRCTKQPTRQHNTGCASRLRLSPKCAAAWELPPTSLPEPELLHVLCLPLSSCLSFCVLSVTGESLRAWLWALPSHSPGLHRDVVLHPASLHYSGHVALPLPSLSVERAVRQSCLLNTWLAALGAKHVLCGPCVSQAVHAVPCHPGPRAAALAQVPVSFALHLNDLLASEVIEPA